MQKQFLLLSFFMLLVLGLAAQNDEARLLRFPAIHGDQVVFTYAGDLYTVDRQGGIARQLTNHQGFEMFARFSPDGSSLAFTGQYDGNTEVFIMPAEGGQPERLTYTATLSRDKVDDRMGPNNIVMTWRPDGQAIVYRSRRYSFNAFRGQLFELSPQGGLSTEIPLHDGGFCSYSPDGKQLAFNRVFREFRTWKYYSGGMADDIWRYDFETESVENLTNNPAQDIFPMWHGDQIFFLSDRDRRMNLFVYDIEARTTRKLTNYDDFDIKFPSLGKDEIIFEKGGFLYIYDIATEKVEKMSIRIANELPYYRAVWKDASKHIQAVDISPQGDRLAVSARGEVFNVPVEEGVTRNMTLRGDAHDRQACWSPDGSKLAYWSDRTGEYQIYIQDNDGHSPVRQLTKDNNNYPYYMRWSPDGKKLLWSDRLFRLRYVDLETGKITEADRGKRWEYKHYAWSPDSRWITFSKQNWEGLETVYLYDCQTTKSYPLTQGRYRSMAPVFSDNGRYLFFVSNRNYEPVYSQTEWNHAYLNMGKLYMLLLAQDTPSPFALEDNSLSFENKEDTEHTDKADSQETRIDIEGLSDRIVELPVVGASYANIRCIGDKVYYLRQQYGEPGSVCYYDLKAKKEHQLGKGMVAEISRDAKKMLVFSKGKYHVIDLPMGSIQLDEAVDLSAMRMKVCLAEEWQQIFDESWRIMRDFFAFPNMHGTDWEAIGQQYGQLVPYVRHRDDLSYIIGEMIGELNIGHAYVLSGDSPKPDRLPMGLLGAKFMRDKRGYYQLSEILQGANWNKQLQSPLRMPGIDVKEGDYILAVNGIESKTVDNINQLLVGTAGQVTELTVNSKADMKGSRRVLVKPLHDESALYYYNWVEKNMAYVDEKTQGQVGYIHVPDMSPRGLNEFMSHFYPQLHKKALIIDDRGNAGGNVSPMIIERLNRKMLMVNVSRNVERGKPNPVDLHLGPKVMLINNYSASDGDLFPARFKALNMGTVVGTRSWGAITGIRSSRPFVDGGQLYVPEFATYSLDGKWLIEGHGVEPDVVIDNDPAKMYRGGDQQLDKAIEIILEQLKNRRETIPPVPDYPDKN